MIGLVMENDDTDTFERIGLAAWHALKVIREKRRAFIGAAPGNGLAGHPSCVASGHDERPDRRIRKAMPGAAGQLRRGEDAPGKGFDGAGCSFPACPDFLVRGLDDSRGVPSKDVPTSHQPGSAGVSLAGQTRRPSNSNSIRARE